MTSSELIKTIYDPNLFPLTFLDDRSQLNYSSLKIKEQIISYYRERCSKLDIDSHKFSVMLTNVLRSPDDVLITRAILLVFMLKNVIDITPFFPMILHRYIFNNLFFNELKNSQRLMLDVIETIHDFIKQRSFDDDNLYPLINDIILANEESPNPIPIKMMKFVDSKDIDENIKRKISKEYPLILPFDMKYKEYTKREIISINSGFPVNRNDILTTVWKFDSLSDYNIKLNINFADEDEIDDKGDLAKEFFVLAFEHVMRPETDLFDLRNGFYWFRYHRIMTNELLKHYQCVGTLFALAILNNVPIPIHFPRYFYKRLLDREPSFGDIAIYNPVLFASLKAIQNSKISGNPSIDFIYIDNLGNYEIDLTNFEDVTDDRYFDPQNVTNENKGKFIENIITWIFEKSNDQAFSAFEEGFKRVSTNEMLLTHFTIGEIDAIVSGETPFIWDDLKKAAKYNEPYNANNKVIAWFWQYFEQLDDDEKLNVLKFITGSTSIPKGGLKDIHIRFNPSDSEIPEADNIHKEFELPEYHTYDELAEKCNETVNLRNNARSFN